MSRLRDLLEIFNVKHEEVVSGGVQLQVVENKKMRMLKLDTTTNSKLNKHALYTGGYWDYFIPLVYAYRKPNILMIGLGLGTTPHQLHALLGNRFSMEIVEFDADVIRLAKKYALGKIKDRIILADGANYVAKTKKKYDIVILDAYWKGANIPSQFFEEKFVRNVSKVLKSNGTLAINYAMHPAGRIRFVGYRRLLGRFFHVFRVKTREVGDTEIILCPKSFSREALLEKIRKNMRRNRGTSPLLDSYEKMSKL